jgi:hypothetical protein
MPQLEDSSEIVSLIHFWMNKWLNLQFSSVYSNELDCLNQIKLFSSRSYVHVTQTVILIFLSSCCICDHIYENCFLLKFCHHFFFHYVSFCCQAVFKFLDSRDTHASASWVAGTADVPSCLICFHFIVQRKPQVSKASKDTHILIFPTFIFL